MNLVVGSIHAVETLAGDATAMASLATSASLGIVLGSDVAMGVISTDVATMTSLIETPAAFDTMMTSATAKAAIFASSTLISVMMADTYAVSVLQGLAITKVGPTPDTIPGDFQSLGIDGNIILLTGTLGSIVATTIDNTFVGDTQGPDVFALPGSSSVAINLPYTNIIWDVDSIAATAAAQVTITYVDFN
jgi:hypothetical protein